MSVVDDILEHVMRIEGGYSNDPADRGSRTMFGVTEAVARAYGYTGAMAALDWTEAKRILRAEFVDRPGLDKIAAIDVAIATEMIDTAINMSPRIAVLFLQRSLNAMRADDSDLLIIDGVCGSRTVDDLRAFLDRRGDRGVAVLRRMLNSLQCERYIALTENRRSNRRFTFGWMLNRVTM